MTWERITGTGRELPSNFFPETSFTLVEPQDHLKADIQDLISRGRKLRWINAGAGDQPGNLLFTIGDRDDSSTFVAASREAPEPGRRQMPVAIRTLNEIVASGDAPLPEMVKIDAEGFDLKVLAGAGDLLGKTEIFLIEAAVCAPGLENTIQEIMRRMIEAGYQLFDVTDLNRSPKSGVLWICELAFIRADSPLLLGLTSYT